MNYHGVLQTVSELEVMSVNHPQKPNNQKTESAGDSILNTRADAALSR